MHYKLLGKTGARRAIFDFPPVNKEKAFDVVDVMREIAAGHNVSIANIALAWLLHQEVVTSVIIGAKTMAQLEDNLNAPNVKLSDDELKKLDEVSALPPEYPGWMLEFQGRGRSANETTEEEESEAAQEPASSQNKED